MNIEYGDVLKTVQYALALSGLRNKCSSGMLAKGNINGLLKNYQNLPYCIPLDV